MVRAFETVRGAEYKWLVRLRSDFKGAPPLSSWPASSHWASFDRQTIYLLGLTGWSRNDARWVPCEYMSLTLDYRHVCAS